MRRSAVVSATLAPIALVGGWTWAAARQPAAYNSFRNTISALAGRGATDRWIMTTALVVLGLCHVVTASGLTEARKTGRVALALGGVMTIAVAALPQPSTGHVPAATAGFVLLALWPAFSAVPSRRAGTAATIVLAAFLCWFGTELHDGSLLGLSERACAGAQALWPLAAVGLVKRSNRLIKR